MKSYSSREVLCILVADGWVIKHQTGSHVQLVHRVKPGKTTIPHLERIWTRRLYGVSRGNPVSCSHRRKTQEAS